MGNESSIPDNKDNSNQMMEQLQKQILENQLEIQRMQINNLQNQQNYNQSPLNAIFSNPKLQQQIAKNPKKKLQLLQNILENYDSSISQIQKHKILQMIEETKRQLSYNTSNGISSDQFLHTNIGTQKQHRTKEEIALSRRQNQNNLETLSKNYLTDEEMEEARFKLEEDKRRQAFYERQRQRRLEYETKLKQLKNDNVNSLRLFQLKSNFTMEELKKSYKNIALKTHPDRPNGSKEKFQLVTKCYFALLEDIKKRQKEQQFDRMRDNSRDYFDERAKLTKKYQAKKSRIINPKDKNFNVKLFNKIFDDNKLYDPNDEGYEDWFKNDADEQPPPKVFSNKFNIDVFNSTFNDYKDSSSSTEIMEYKEPQAIVSCNQISHTDIDSRVVSDYSKAPEAANNLGYSDLKAAYTKNNNLINTNNVKIKQYRNVDDYEKDRSNISFTMTPEQLREQAIQQQIEQQREEERLQRIQERDSMTENHYNNLHQRMLGF